MPTYVRVRPPATRQFITLHCSILLSKFSGGNRTLGTGRSNERGRGRAAVVAQTAQICCACTAVHLIAQHDFVA